VLQVYITFYSLFPMWLIAGSTNMALTRCFGGIRSTLCSNRVVQSCHLLATYHVTYFTTYLIRRTRRRAISGIMNFIDAYSQAPTYCLCLSGRLFGNPNSGCSPDLFSLTCLLFPCVVVPSLIIASLVFSHTPPLLLGQRIHLLSRWLVQS
jgi:hypothetical protein